MAEPIRKLTLNRPPIEVVTLDRSKAFGLVYGEARARYEQDGKRFDRYGILIRESQDKGK